MRKITDEYLQLENNLKTEYIFVKNIKNKDEAIVNVLESKTTGERILVKYFNGTADVYKKLLNFSHPNLPKVYKVVEVDRKCIVVEEFINGITIDETLQIERYSSASVKKIILQLCSVLSLIHQDGIVHRDIKPENIIVDNNGNVKLLDFNISRINKDNQSKDTLMLGTTGFAAPEQYGISETDARSDIYSIGILINVMLTGEHPSKKLCTGKWQRIVNKCTRINPKDRYNNVKELEADLSTNKLIVPLVMSAIIVLVAITIVICSSRNKPQNTTPETTLADAQSEATKNTDEKETTSTKETTTVLETTTTEEETTAEEVTTEPPTTVVEVPTTEQATSQEATTKYEEPTTEESTELNYTITLEGTEITVSGNGKISKGKNFYFTDPYISSKERGRLNSAVFCEGITNIPSGAFLNCGSFGEITIPNTVIDIEDHALSGTTVQVVEIPESVEYLGESAFSGNNVLSIVNLSEGLKTIDYACFSGCGSLASIVIPESVEYIGVSAFSGTRLKSIVLPSKLKKLEKDTFLICEFLKGITLPDTLESIGDYCFGSCHSLEKIIIPPSVTYIGNYAFSNCENLVIYVTPGSYAEQYCIDNELEYNYVDSIATIERYTFTGQGDHFENSSFANDWALEEVILPDDFTGIDQYCFYGCINLKRINIPPSVTFIGENCFLGCDNLVIYVTPGSYAEQYCIDNGLKYEYVGL